MVEQHDAFGTPVTLVSVATGTLMLTRVGVGVAEVMAKGMGWWTLASPTWLWGGLWFPRRVRRCFR